MTVRALNARFSEVWEDRANCDRSRVGAQLHRDALGVALMTVRQYLMVVLFITTCYYYNHSLYYCKDCGYGNSNAERERWI